MSEDTRNKILKVAGQLFAKNGFDGTSIREISKAADTNLASVNYHFKNKQNLFTEVLDSSLTEIESQIQKISLESSCIKDFSYSLFQHLTNNNEVFKNSFKLFITDNLPLSSDFIPKACGGDFNPPGFRIMLNLLTEELGETLPLKGREWAVRSIFCYVVHSALVLSSTLAKMMAASAPHLQGDEKRKSIENLTDSVTNYLKEHPEKFK